MVLVIITSERWRHSLEGGDYPRITTPPGVPYRYSKSSLMCQKNVSFCAGGGSQQFRIPNSDISGCGLYTLNPIEHSPIN